MQLTTLMSLAVMGTSFVFTVAVVATINLIVSNWKGYMAADAIANFNKTAGNNAKLVLYGTNEEIIGKLLAVKEKGYDVVFVSSPFAEVLNHLVQAEKLDHRKLPTITFLCPQASQHGGDESVI